VKHGLVADAGDATIRPLRISRGARIASLLFAAGISVTVAEDVKAAAASEQQEPVQTSWVTAKLPGVPLSVKYPANWVVPPNALENSAAKRTLLSLADPQNGDNLVVYRYRGKLAYWYTGIRDYRDNAQQSADVSNGQLLSASKSKVGNFSAYRHVKTYMDVTVHTQIIYGEIEIRQKRGSVISLLVSLNAGGPAARQDVDAILDGITAT
jgi:hypothetical protein